VNAKINAAEGDQAGADCGRQPHPPTAVSERQHGGSGKRGDGMAAGKRGEVWRGDDGPNINRARAQSQELKDEGEHLAGQQCHQHRQPGPALLANDQCNTNRWKQGQPGVSDDHHYGIKNRVGEGLVEEGQQSLIH